MTRTHYHKIPHVQAALFYARQDMDRLLDEVISTQAIHIPGSRFDH